MTVQVRTTTIPEKHLKRVVASVADVEYHAWADQAGYVHVSCASRIGPDLAFYDRGQLDALIEVLHAAKHEFGDPAAPTTEPDPEVDIHTLEPTA